MKGKVFIMAKRTVEERINDVEEQMEQLKAKQRALKKQQSEAERKKRTKRLIEMGAIVESVLGRATTDDDKKRLEDFLKMQERNGLYFSKAMNERSVAQATLIRE